MKKSVIVADERTKEHPFVKLMRNTLNLPVDKCFYVGVSLEPGLLPKISVSHFTDCCTATRDVDYVLHEDGRVTVLRESVQSNVSQLVISSLEIKPRKTK